MYDINKIMIFINNKEINNSIIYDLYISNKYNEHSKLYISFEIENKIEEIEKAIYLEKNDIKIEIDKKEVFYGKIINMNKKIYGNKGNKIEIKGISTSKEMDDINNKKYRIYQDINTKYSQIIKEIMSEYRIEYKIDEYLNNKIDRIYIQYDETDWEFINRILSNIDKKIYITSKNIIIFGETNINKTVDIGENINVEYGKNEFNNYIQLTTDNIGMVYQNYIYNNEDYKIHESYIYTENGIIKNKFISIINRYKKIDIFNKNIKGARIEAVVEEVNNINGIAMMKVNMTNGIKKLNSKYIDKSKNKINISYQTFYSQTNTGLFCTPERGDVVEVYFPHKDERYIKVSWAINNPKNGRFSDYNNRNFHINGTDFNIKINDKEINITTKDRLTINSKSNNIISDNHNIKIKENIKISADKDIDINAKDDMDVEIGKLELNTKKGNIRLNSSNEIKLIATKIQNN